MSGPAGIVSGSQSGWYTDLHTLNIRTGGATKQEVSDAFRRAVGEAEEKLGRTFPHRFYINMPCNSAGQTLGFCYIYITEPAVYRMAVGMTPDGDPSEEKLLVMRREVEEGRFEEFDVNPCFVFEPEKPQLAHNVLKSSNLPEWMTEEDLKGVFSPFSTREGFPKIKVVQMVRTAQLKGKGGAKRVEKVAFITFDPETREGQFALNMRKKFEVADEKGKRFVFFDLAHQADIRRAEGGKEAPGKL